MLIMIKSTLLIHGKARTRAPSLSGDGIHALATLCAPAGVGGFITVRNHDSQDSVSKSGSHFSYIFHTYI